MGCELCVLGPSGGVSFEYTKNKTHSNALNINKKTTSIITDPGPVEDAVDHNFDQIWLFLHPKFDVTITGTKITGRWIPISRRACRSISMLAQLKDPSKIPPGVLKDLQAAGITPDDYKVILSADPLAQCLPVVMEQSRSQQPPARRPCPFSARRPPRRHRDMSQQTSTSLTTRPSPPGNRCPYRPTRSTTHLSQRTRTHLRTTTRSV